MPVPIFVDEIFCRSLAQGAEPLGAKRRRPDKVALCDRVPMITQAIDAAAGKHQETVLHYVSFDERQRRSRLISHGVHCQVEGWIVGHQRAYLECLVPYKRLRGDEAFASCKEAGHERARDGSIGLFDDRRASSAFGRQVQAAPLGKVREITGCEAMPVNFEITVEHIDETLAGRRTQLSSLFELRGVLRELGADRRPNVYDGSRLPHAGKRHADERVRRLQNMIGAVNAAGLSKVVHVVFQVQAGRTSVPRLRPTIFPATKTLSPRRIVRTTAPWKHEPTYGLE